MPATNYTPGFGSSVYWATNTAGTAGSYTKLSNTKDIKGDDSEVGDIKVTNNDSPDNTKEYGPGMTEPGTIEWEMVYNKTAYNTLVGMKGDGNLYFWKEVFADGSTIVVPGFIKKIPLVTKTEDEANMMTVTVRCTGKSVFTPGS